MNTNASLTAWDLFHRTESTFCRNKYLHTISFDYILQKNYSMSMLKTQVHSSFWTQKPSRKRSFFAALFRAPFSPVLWVMRPLFFLFKPYLRIFIGQGDTRNVDSVYIRGSDVPRKMREPRESPAETAACLPRM